MKDHIYDYWNNQGKKYKTDPTASWGDSHCIALEIEEIANYLKDGASVLDIGCANGYSAASQIDKKDIKITGIDFSEEMIDAANTRRSKNSDYMKKLSFELGDIRDIKKPDDSFDVVYTTRVLINLPNWEEQRKGIEECIRVCKKGGLVIFSESFWEPLSKLNTIRMAFGVEPLGMHNFNRYLKKNDLEEYLDSRKIKFECIDFSSVYYLGTRVLNLVLIDQEKYPPYTSPLNDVFYELEKKYSGGDIGLQQLYVLHL